MMGDSDVEGSRGPAWAAGAGWGHPVCRPGRAHRLARLDRPASWRKRDQLCPAPRSFPAPLQWAFGNTVQSREQGKLRGSQRRGLGGRARPLPGASAAWWARGRLKGRGLRPAQASARRRNREGEGAGCQRPWPEGGAFSLSGFLLRNTWFLQVRETQASERGAALPEGAAAPSRPRPPPHPGTPTPPCFKPQAL